MDLRFSMGMDVNGNRLLQVKPRVGRAFSIQTNNGSFKQTHRYGLDSYTLDELCDYIALCGTPRQREAVGVRMTDRYKTCQKCGGTGRYHTKLKDLGTLNMVDSIVSCDVLGCKNGTVDLEMQRRSWIMVEFKT